MIPVTDPYEDDEEDYCDECGGPCQDGYDEDDDEVYE